MLPGADSVDAAQGARLLGLFCAIYVLAFLSTTILHELAHALVSAALGGKTVLHHVFVRHEGHHGGRAAAIAAAGPLFSLCQGVLVALVALKLPASSGVAPPVRLFLFWFSLHGLVNFFGYLLTTPFVADADLGKVAAWLELSSFAKWALFAGGGGAILLLGSVATMPLLSFGLSPAMLADGAGRASTIVWIGVLPWLIGSVLMAAASFPSPHWISYAYPFLSGTFLLGSWRRAARSSPPDVTPGQWQTVAVWPWLLALSALLLVFVLVLRPGVRIRS
jgi:hypothetical protein